MKRYISLLLAAVMLTGLLAGCGGDANTPSGGNGGGQGGASAGDTVNLRSQIAMQTTDPADTNKTDELTINEQIYEGLYTLDEVGGGYKMLLAKEVNISDDGLVYDITLQPGVKFHNGEPLKASDVVFSYNHFMGNAKYNSYTDMLSDIEAVDDGHVRITLNRPYSPILHTFFKIKILSEKEVTAQGAEFGTKTNLAGTGPYHWDESAYNANTGWTLRAFEDYWQGAPAIKNVNYKVIVDNASAVIALQNGEVDAMLQVPLTSWEEVKSSGKFETAEMESNNVHFLSINYEANEVLENDLVRQAIAYAMDRDAMNMAANEGLGTVTDFYINPHYAEAAPTECSVSYPHDLAKAKELLTQAGYPDGVDVGEILVGTGSSEPFATVLQANLAEAGIATTITTLEFGAAFDRMCSQDFNLCIVADSGNYDFNNYRQQVHSGSKGIYQVKFEGDKFDWKHFDELFAVGERLTDPAERKANYTELYNAVMETYCLLPLVVPPVCAAWNPDLNLVTVPTYYHVSDWSWNNA